MKKTVLIVEDDIDQLNILKKLVLLVSENTVIYLSDNAISAYSLLLEKTIDVFLVDIILDTKKPGDTSGIKLVEKLRRISKYMFTPVIFVTSMEDPTKYCFTDLNCIGYIEKPFEAEGIMKLIERALNFSTEREKDVSFTFRKDGVLYPVKLQEIVYLESLNHIMYIHLSNGAVLEIPYITCKQVLSEADTDCLIQCSRYALINKEYVDSVDLINRFIMFKDSMGRTDIGITFKKKMLMEFGHDC